MLACISDEIRNKAWRGFVGRKWQEDINVREFIQSNYTMYDGDESFLEAPTDATNKLWGRLQELQKEERAKGGVLEWSADRQALKARVHALRRNQDG